MDLFCRFCETTADKDLAEEALGRHGDERVARGGGDVAAVDVTPFGSLGQVGFTRVGLEVERELALDRTHHRRGPRHTEGHVVRLQNLDRTHQADGEERGHETDGYERDQGLLRHSPPIVPPIACQTMMRKTEPNHQPLAATTISTSLHQGVCECVASVDDNPTAREAPHRKLVAGQGPVIDTPVSSDYSLLLAADTIVVGTEAVCASREASAGQSSSGI